ncbi:hypothetical protein PBI_JEANIE_12 [Gordonia phage Jeanie]|uniref:Uncharacterized protein n=2 Tax=root TaxID=1 RepID=A0A160DHC0_9CAUD|nr:hypothetical protein [Gordonia neofelifaecis]YP_009274024.1 hypothetical protein BH764_gp12 [Gordonia phage McGonagall]ANA87590.1 hypothetical protein MCGONAGALL_12 [Gordonia phage McGonagall]ANA87617.1 hypothetical protein PBI_JEANIE_12 [Gordonia phage Jeanie]EGD53213.1 hypothetical protein SCNU_20037 [Gordonia neofelifaecis NRRL B-59395]
MSSKPITRIILDVLMLDGTEHRDIVVTNADRLKGEATGRRQKWGTLQESQQTYTTFWAYAALVRLGRFTGSFDDFINASETIDEAGTDTVDPTATATLTD